MPHEVPQVSLTDDEIADFVELRATYRDIPLTGDDRTDLAALRAEELFEERWSGHTPRREDVR